MDDNISDIESEVKSTNFVFYFALLPLRKKTERYASLMLEACFMKIGVYLLLHPCNSTMAARGYIPAPDLLPTDNPCAEEKEEAQAITQGGIRAARWFF